jgi:hypothetical protein
VATSSPDRVECARCSVPRSQPKQFQPVTLTRRPYDDEFVRSNTVDRDSNWRVVGQPHKLAPIHACRPSGGLQTGPLLRKEVVVTDQ